MYSWRSLCNLYLLACRVTVIAGDSGLCCCVSCYTVTSVERYQFPSFADFTQKIQLVIGICRPVNRIGSPQDTIKTDIIHEDQTVLTDREKIYSYREQTALSGKEQTALTPLRTHTTYLLKTCRRRATRGRRRRPARSTERRPRRLAGRRRFLKAG